MHCVGRTQTFWMLKPVVHNISLRLLKVNETEQQWQAVSISLNTLPLPSYPAMSFAWISTTNTQAFPQLPTCLFCLLRIRFEISDMTSFHFLSFLDIRWPSNGVACVGLTSTVKYVHQDGAHLRKKQFTALCGQQFEFTAHRRTHRYAICWESEAFRFNPHLVKSLLLICEQFCTFLFLFFLYWRWNQCDSPKRRYLRIREEDRSAV